MKTEFTDVSETKKTLTIEIPSDVVDAEINKVAKDYSKQAKIPGFRPGKVPATIVKQRFKDQILHDVMHGLIPRAVDEYLQFLSAYPGQESRAQLDNPAWHIHTGDPPAAELPISFALLLNLVAASNAEDKAVLWGFIRRHVPDATPEAHPLLDHLAGYAVNYYRDFVKPEKKYRAATDMERAAFEDLVRELEKLPADAPAEDIQFQVYEVGKRHAFADLKAWFQSLYEVLFGQTQGPRMGTFIALYGIKETIVLIRRALAGELLAPA